MRISDWSSDVCSSDLSVAVRVRDNKRVSEALAAVTAAGANIVSGPNLSVTDPEKAKLGASGTAYKAARAKADAYADAANLRVTRVLASRDGGHGGNRSDESRVGQESVWTCGFRVEKVNVQKKKTNENT